jgi:hypothetical protein
MRTLRVYKHPIHRFEAINVGFSWPAFFFGRVLAVFKFLSLLLLVCVVGTVSPVGATIVNPVTDEQLVKNAELIVQGVVTKIEHRISDGESRSHAQLPHTFVTFYVEKILKGSIAGPSNQFNLRFLGGPNHKRKRFLRVEECPLFNVGERGVLFVRRNERHICPLVGWMQGRFRIIGANEIFNDNGREVWLTTEKKLAFGKAHPLSEVLTHQRGPNVFARKVSSEKQPEEPVPPPPPIQGTRLSADGFLAFIAGLVSILHTPEELANLPPVKSANPGQPFYFTQPRAVGPGSGIPIPTD